MCGAEKRTDFADVAIAQRVPIAFAVRAGAASVGNGIANEEKFAFGRDFHSVGLGESRAGVKPLKRDFSNSAYTTERDTFPPAPRD